ncbi:MAG: LPS export ABC transporter permease LptG [Bdellovibrio sp.]|nr:MAG: LPS export ABC transporter permease LptG [Bdellovibrio sp.]
MLSLISIIDRYLIRSFLLYFIAGLAVFVTLFLAIDFVSSLANLKAPLNSLLHYYLYSIPSVIYQMIPVGALVGILFTLSQLNKGNELIALFSLGMSLARVSLPLLILILIISFFSFFMENTLLPVLNQKKNYVYYMELIHRPEMYASIKTNKIWFRSKNVLFNVRTLDVKGAQAQGVSFFYFNKDWKLSQVLKASKAHIQGKKWILEDGQITLFVPESSFPLTQSFQKKEVLLDTEVIDAREAVRSSDTLSANELAQFIKKNKEAGLDTTRYEVDYHSKFSFPFAAFVMSLMGIPFAVSRVRQGGNVKNIGICLGLAFVYWLLYSAFITLGRYGHLPPVLAAWGPNVLLTFSFLFFLIKIRK